ncbi:MAG TPA: tetratricopeptide repeat protein [Terriglobia bacterium]|nr:tetratricopeptide repeat protein [Terriglobia bacterium]
MKIDFRLPTRMLPGVMLFVLLWSVSLSAPSLSGQAERGKDPNTLAEQAQAALKARDYGLAIERLKELARAVPKVGEVHANLCIAYYSSGQFAEAAGECRTALGLKPGLANAHYFLGASLAEGGYCKEALPYLEKDFQRVTDKSLKRIIGTDALRCHMDSSETDRAIDLDRSLAHQYPDDPEILYLTAHLFSNLSASASQHLLAVGPGSYQFHRMNAEVLEIQGKLDDAMAEFRKVLEINPHVAGIHYAIGMLLVQQGPASLGKAREEFEAELKTDPGNAAAEFELGKIAASLRDKDEALAHLQRATRLNPDLVAAQIALGEAYVSAGRVQEALAPLERAVAVAPGNPTAHYRLAFVYRRLGRAQEAAQQLALYRKSEKGILQTRQKIRSGVAGGSEGESKDD